MRVLSLILFLATAFGQSPAAKPSIAQWKIKFFHDHNDSTIDFRELVAPAPGTVCAFGVLSEEGSRPRGVMVNSRDGGKSFQTVKLPDIPMAAHFLDANNGWLVTRDAVHRTLDGGLTWKRASKLGGVLRVAFLNPQRGFAVGVPKAIWSTDDGGVKWAKVPEAQAPQSRAENTAYTTVVFRDALHGLITGHSRPPRRDASPLPPWMDPDVQKPLVPNLLLILETKDGGLTWNPQVASVFGQVMRVAFGKATSPGLALMDYQGEFSYSSEIVNLSTSQSAFRSKERAIKDLAYAGDGRMWAASVSVPGKLNHLPIPSKVEVLQSIDGKNWYSLPVDYKAVANRLKLAFSGNEGWLATDGGMILALQGM